MSQRALLLAVRDHLRSLTPSGTNATATVATGIGQLYPNANQWIDVTVDGKPWANVGQVFLAVWPGNFSATNTSTECLDEQVEVSVTVSVRLPVMPEDRWMKILCPDSVDGKMPGSVVPGLLGLCEAVRATLHLNYDVTTRANTYINNANSGPPTNGFEEPLFFASISRPEKKSGGWFSSKEKERYAGLAATVNFHPARRTQRADLQT